MIRISKDDGYVLCPRCKGRAMVEVEIAIADEHGVQIGGKHPIFRKEMKPCPCANGDRPGYTYMPPQVSPDGKVRWSKYFNEQNRSY